jgi:hypothetical protein
MQNINGKRECFIFEFLPFPKTKVSGRVSGKEKVMQNINGNVNGPELNFGRHRLVFIAAA